MCQKMNGGRTPTGRPLPHCDGAHRLRRRPTVRAVIGDEKGAPIKLARFVVGPYQLFYLFFYVAPSLNVRIAFRLRLMRACG